MNDMARRMLEDRMRGGDHRGRDYGEYPPDHRDYRGHMEYRGEIEHDGRRGRYSMMRDRGADYRRDYGHEDMMLSRSDIKRWKHNLKNADGTVGEHFTMEHMREAIHQIGARFDDYDEADLCMTANMLYSDLCEALHSMIPKEKEALTYAKMAMSWLEDEDGARGAEKLALYYYCIVDGDE